MSLLYVPALLAVGYLVRDGLPDLRSLTDGKLGTQAARAFGGIFVLAGSIVALPSWWGVATGLALVAGFWTDARHGAGQRARSEAWQEDALYLAVSGISSLAPAALAIFYHDSKTALALLFCGLVAKPFIWFLAWRGAPERFYPTRIAAGVFGALVGLILLGGAL